MKRIFPFVMLSLLAAVFSARGETLTTEFVGGNGNNGVMFDVVADKPLTVTALAFSAFSVTSTPVEIYTKVGTFVGSEGTPASWTLVASGPITAAAANVALAPFFLSSPVAIPGGGRQAFYIRFASGQSIAYSNGDGVGSLEAQDANLRIFEGTGIAGSFGATTPDRIPNVTITYSPLPSSLTTTYAGGSSASGVMFDVVANRALSISALQFAPNAVGSATVEIYTKSGTHVGSEGDPAAWTSLGLAAFTATVADVAGAPFFVPPIMIAAGARQAFYIRTTGLSVSYTIGDGVGTLEAQDGNLSIFEGTGISGTFGGSFPERIPNVTLRYAVASPGDTAAPRITIIGRPNFRTTAKSVPIFGLATDDVGVASVRATFKTKKGMTTRLLTPDADGIFRLKLKPLPGRNRVTFVATDVTGKSSAPSRVTVILRVAK